MTNDANIRLECLKPAERWAQPTGEEVREVLRLAGSAAARPRRRWGWARRATARSAAGSARTPDSYAAWAILCDQAGLGVIWKRLTPRKGFSG
jgi:hypothetical protein